MTEGPAFKYEWSIESACADAEQAGMKVIRTSPTRLLIDIDSEAGMLQFQQSFESLKAHFGISETGRYRSNSNKENHWHIILACNEQSIEMRIALQFALGSDPKREMLALMMILDGVENPSVLFAPKGRDV